IELDSANATAWVNDTDWLTYLVDVLGGCDGDDAVWVFPFSDQSDAGKQKLLVWRSPNQMGEYAVLEPTASSHIIAWDVPGGRQLTYPKMNSRLLPPRIDICTYQYGELSEAGDAHRTYVSYSVAAMSATIAQAAANQGVLGGFCNVAMLCKAVYGCLPNQLPATLEAIIDGSVKTGLDLTPVKEWNQMAVGRMVNHGLTNPNRAMPQAMLDRLPSWLRDQAAAALANSPKTHWLDTLTVALENHRAQYWADVEALAAEACPPVTLFEHGGSWLHLGKELRQAYSRVMRHAFQADELCENESGLSTDASFAAARVASEAYLSQWPAEKRPLVLLGAAAYLYAQGPQAGEPVRDALIWQLGARRSVDSSGREPGLAQATIQALRQIGLLGEPIWTTVGAVLHYADEPNKQAAGVPVRLNGVWLNLLNATAKRPYTRMADVPLTERSQAKTRIADYVQDQFRGMMLTTEVTDDNRVVTRTPHGNLFGYVQRDHELAAVRYDQWRIAWAHAIDGNVLAVLEPARL
ncbi:MAG: hypothetical protein KC434_17270, partial [Anaerolineales bacterium]|nr:hypothetical protein [Anaerolineales bacterium]